jgi:hypothetical protein
MSVESPEPKSDTETPLYLGALVTGVIGLLPYLNVSSSRLTSSGLVSQSARRCGSGRFSASKTERNSDF